MLQKPLSFSLPSPTANLPCKFEECQHTTYKPKGLSQRRDVRERNIQKSTITTRLLMPLPTPPFPPALTHLMILKRILRSPADPPRNIYEYRGGIFFPSPPHPPSSPCEPSFSLLSPTSDLVLAHHHPSLPRRWRKEEGHWRSSGAGKTKQKHFVHGVAKPRNYPRAGSRRPRSNKAIR